MYVFIRGAYLIWCSTFGLAIHSFKSIIKSFNEQQQQQQKRFVFYCYRRFVIVLPLLLLALLFRLVFVFDTLHRTEFEQSEKLKKKRVKEGGYRRKKVNIFNTIIAHN